MDTDLNLQGEVVKSLKGLNRKKGEFFEEEGMAAGGEVVFPDAEDAPAAGAEFAGDEAVAGGVGGEFFAPEGGVVFGLGGVFGTAVPKATVHKYGEAELGEDEVGFAEDRLMASPAGDAVSAEQGSQGQLGFLVSTPANAGHHLGALGLGEDVRHFPASAASFLVAI
jgi:hypothetical protein